MSFLSDYKAALKKLKKEDEEEVVNHSSNRSSSASSGKAASEGSFMDTYRSELSKLQAAEEKKKTSISDRMTVGTVGGIAPVRADADSGNKRKWFQTGAFEDGYQFGDVTKTILGSATDIAENLTTGVIGMGEKAVDTLAYLAPAAMKAQYYADAPLMGTNTQRLVDEAYEESKKASAEFIKKDLYDEEDVAKKILAGVSSGAYLGNIAQSGAQITQKDLDRAKEIQGVSKDFLDNSLEGYSVLGEKSDALVQSAGQLGATMALSAAGLPWWATTGVTSFGGETEAAFGNGATYEEAGLSAAASAGAEILSEKISGGISFGGKTLDDALTKQLARSVSNKTVRTLAKLGMDMAGEGAEEILSGAMSAVGQKLTYADDKELNELFSSEDAWEAFIGGAVLGGAAGGVNAAKSAAQGVDYASGLTDNEQKVVDKVYKDAVAEAEKDGKELKQREKAKLYDDVLNQMEKGYISTDTIEEVLGGDSYTEYQDTIKNADAMQEEYNTLYKMKHADKSDEQIDRQAELKKQLDELKATDKRNVLKTQLGDTVRGLVAGDRLAESYNERGRKSQAYEADLTKYDEKQQAVIQKAVDSGILNNTNRTHEFVDMVAKISADKGVLFDFTNNEKLKESGFAVKDRVVNGYVTKDGVALNIDSAKALNSTVGHEITHVLEGTEFYSELQKTLFDYAKSKNDFDGRHEALAKLYETVEGADIDAELTADLVGDYLFSDTDFINRLSVENRNVFQKVWDEIKYLCKVATAGSKEARELEKVKRAFEKAYKEGGKAQTETDATAAPDADVKYSIREEAPPKNTGIAYKVFFVKDGKLYPPMVANPGGADTPMGVWLNADVGAAAPNSKTGRQQVKAGGKGTQGGSGSLAFRPGWHLGDLPRASQFDRLNPETGQKELFPENFVWAEVEYAKDIDYQEEAMSYGYTDNGKFRHAYAGLPRLPENGYYRYRTNPKPDTVPWVITGAMKVNRLLSDAEVNEILEKNGVPPVHRQGGDVGLDKFGFAEDGTARTDDSVKYSLDGYTDEMVDNTKKIVSKLKRELMASRYGMHKYASYTAERIARELQDSMAEGLPDYAHSYIAWVNPEDFLRATVGDQAYYERVRAEAGELDYEKLKGETQPIYLHIDSKTNRIVGHEGRHRISALGKAGYDRVAIIIRTNSANDIGQMLFPEERLKLGGQVFENGWPVTSSKEGVGFWAHDLLPLSERFADTARQMFAETDGSLKFSLSDSTGKQLTAEQQEYFKDSKVRDENGSLKVMYHGTPNGNFTVFKDGTYFTDSKEYADGYQNPNASMLRPNKDASAPKTFEVYLDIKKPFDLNDAEARRIYIEEYIKGGNALGINPYLSDAEYAKIKTVDWTEGEDLRDFLIEEGYDYDGLVLDEGAVGGYGDEVKSRGTSYVVFSPEQVKNVDNQKPTADPDIRFSLSKPVEETKDLMALHNLHTAELLETIKLNGLPSPSVAIIKAKDGHEKYGDVSLILPKGAIDPQANKANRIYGSDAWTPTRSNAQVEYEVDYNIQRQFERTIEDLSKNVANGVFSKSSVLGMAGVEGSTGLNLNEIAKKISDYDAVQAAYVAETGGDVDVVYRTKEFDPYGNDTLKGYIDKVGEQEVARLAAKMITGERLSAEEVEVAKDALVADWVRKKAYALKQKPELREIRISKFRERLTNMRVEDFVRHAWEFYEDSGATTDEIDRGATGNNLRAAANRADVEAWVAEKLQGLLSEPGIYNGKDVFTPSGKRRSFKETHWDYTAENIVKAMNNADARGANVWNVSGEAIIATATQEYKSIDEVRADKDRLHKADADNYEKIKDEISEELQTVTTDIIRTTEHHSDNQYDEEQIIGRVIMEAAQGTKTVAAVKRVFLKNGYRIGDAQAKSVLSLFDRASNVPTGYFEAKPQRVVGLDEVGVFVIPNNADVKLKQELLNRGYSIAEYDPNIEGHRQQVVNQFEEYKFSLSNVGETPKEYGRWNVYGKDIKLQSEEDVAPVETVSDTETGTEPESVIQTPESLLNDLSEQRSQVLEQAMALDKKKGRTEAESFEMERLYKKADEIAIEIDDLVTERFYPAAIYNKRDGENGWGSVYATAQQVLDSAVRKVNRELWTAIRNEVTYSYENKVPFTPMLSAEIAVQEDVRQETITPMQGARLLSEVYSQGGAEALKQIYNPRTGNLWPKYLEQAKQYATVALAGEAALFPDDFAPMTEEEAAVIDQDRLDSLTDADAPMETDAEYYEMADAIPLTKKAENDIARLVRAQLGLSNNQMADAHNLIREYSESEFPDREALRTALQDRFGEYAVTETDDILADIKYDLRNSAISVSDKIKGDIPDYGKFMRSNFGKVRTGNAGTPVDVRYMELSEAYPGYFPADITNPTDQLLQIIEVANRPTMNEYGARIDEDTIDEVTDIIVSGVSEYKRTQREMAAARNSRASFNSLLETGDDFAPIAETVAPAPVATERHEAIRPKQQKQPRLAKATPAEQARADILVDEPEPEKKKPKLWSMIKNNVLDKGMVFEDLSLATGNRELQARWNSIRYAEGKAQRQMEKGSATAPSLDSIRKAVEKTGKTKQFYEYLYHLHNADRMTLAERYADTPNKPVFGNAVTADVSREAAASLEKANPDFKRFAQDVYSYMNNLRNELVAGGVISTETARLWEEMYPHYVPIRRVGDTGLNINVPLDTGRTGVNAPIKRATGGSRDILPLFDTMGQRTIQTYKAIAKNRFGVELKNTLGTTIADEATTVDEAIDGVDAQESLLQEGKNGRKPTFTVFENGKKVTFEITDEMYDAMKPKTEAMAYTNKALNTVNNARRGLLTEYNPAFMLTNPIKDTQDVLINSQHAARTYANYPKAIAELLSKKGHWYQEYMENGGEQNTYFDNETNTFAKEKSKWAKVAGFPLEKISDANNFIERIPRLAEYIASRKQGRSIDVSMLDAARVTTNFAAGGDLTKFLNRNGATFLNASVQGFMQNVRNVREAKANGVKGVLTLAAKFSVAGLSAMALNHLLWDDDEDYEELSDYVKQNYYIVGKYDDGKFVRIPKGRTLAVIQNAFEQMENLVTGDDEVDLMTFADLALSNLAPNNPLDNNILSPIVDVATNETWYGDDMVPSRLADLPAAEQYDETTDSISKWLGETLNYSPVKINYLLDQYSGGIGDTFLPMLTPEAERGDNTLLAPILDKFTTDSVLKNQNVSDFYTVKDELTVTANGRYATDEDILKSKYMSSVNAELGKLYGMKRDVQNSDLTDEEKYEEVRAIQNQIVEMAKDGLNTYNSVFVEGNYASVGDRHYRRNNDGEWQKLTDKQVEQQEEVTSGLGISEAEYWSNKDEYDYAYDSPEKYAVAKAVGGYSSFKTYSSELYDIKADKDEDGKSISGSRKDKVIDYINGLDADYGEKIILFKSEYNADDTYNSDIVDYLNNRDDISFEEMQTILKELGFTVYADGTIEW